MGDRSLPILDAVPWLAVRAVVDVVVPHMPGRCVVPFRATAVVAASVILNVGVSSTLQLTARPIMQLSIEAVFACLRWISVPEV